MRRRELVDVEVGGVDDDVARLAQSRRAARARRAMPSRRVPSPCSGCGRRTCSKRRTSAASVASRKSTRTFASAAQRLRSISLHVGEKLAAAHVDDRGDLRAARSPACSARSTSGREHLRRQVVDDVPAEVLERVADRRAAGAGHAGDDEHLAAARRQLISVMRFARGSTLSLACRRRLARPNGRAMVAARAGPMPCDLGDLGLGSRCLQPGDRAEVLAAAPSHAPARGPGSRRARERDVALALLPLVA